MPAFTKILLVFYAIRMEAMVSHDILRAPIKNQKTLHLIL